MSDMSHQETLERFSESMKRAIACAREIATLERKAVWNTVADRLDALRAKGWQTARARSKAKAEVERELDAHQEALGIKVEEKNKKTST